MWKEYIKKESTTARPYVEGEDLSDISIADCNSPGVGGMIARNKSDHSDQWYISSEYFAANYELKGD